MISFATWDSYNEGEPAPDAPSVPELVGAARRGCPIARGLLCERVRPFVLRRAKRMIPARLQAKVDPEDLAQDVLLEFCRGIDSLVGEEEAQIRGWLGRATINRGRDLLRRFGRGSKRDVNREKKMLALPHVPLLSTNAARHADCPVQQAILSELWQIVRAAIVRLPEERRRAIELYLNGGQRYADVARSLGKTSEAARKLCGRARHQLQGELRARQVLA